MEPTSRRCSLTTVLAFGIAALLFDPEQRFIHRPAQRELIHREAGGYGELPSTTSDTENTENSLLWVSSIAIRMPGRETTRKCVVLRVLRLLCG